MLVSIGHDGHPFINACVSSEVDETCVFLYIEKKRSKSPERSLFYHKIIYFDCKIAATATCGLSREFPGAQKNGTPFP